MRRSALFLLSSLVPLAAGAATAPATDTRESSLQAAEAAPALPTAAERVTTQGGTLTARWNDDLLRDLRMPRVDASQATTTFAISKSGRFEADVSGGTVLGFAGGSVALTGGAKFALPGSTIDWSGLRAIARHDKDTRIDFVAADGSVSFYADRIMWELVDEGRTFHIRSADLRIGAGLAQRMGNPDAADLAVAEIKALAPIVDRDASRWTLPKAAGDPNWPGEQVAGQPAGTKYLADVFMAGFTGQYSRCRATAGGGTCDGPGGATDGDVVFTPSSTLANNRNNGTAVATIGGDPLGTSTSLWTADVPWYQKFTSSPNNPAFAYPYLMNDQHPFLVWNLYRIDNVGGVQTITQIGRSGAKHAFLTTNVGSGCDTSNGNHVLGRQCGDTYGTGNNDSSTDLGPRSEIIPATGQWGRCGSIYDTNCDGTANASPNGSFDQRMIVKESAIAAASNPGSTWLFESWYLIRDDINIYNTMGTVPWAAQFGTSWSSPTGSQSPFRLGPAIDRWVAAGTNTATQRNVELVAPEGHTKVAVQATDLGGGSWRYEYAVMNFDFARSATTGKEDDHTLRVLRNNGFNSFSLPIAPGASITSTSFNDGDANAANDWAATVQANRIVWSAPNDPSSLNWASMYRFSVVANAAPLSAAVRLGVTEPGTPTQYEVANLLTLTPGALAVFGPTDAIVLEDAAAAGRAFTVFDPETPAAISVVASSSDPLLFPVGSVNVTGANTDRTVTLSPAANRSGSATITLTATDGDNNTATATFTATVTPVNDAPTLVLGANPVEPFGTSGARSLPGFVANVDYGAFETQSVAAYNVVETSDLSNVVSSASIALNGTLVYTLTGTSGTATFTASVRDDGGTANGGVDTSGPVTFTITVLNDTLFSDGFE